MGCTEPIAPALAAAKAAEVLGDTPDTITAACSGNMIKNVRCVSIPNSGGRIGMDAACLLGAVAGDASAEMDVLARVNDEGLAKTAERLEKRACTVTFLDSEIPLHFILKLEKDGHSAEVEVRHSHTNIVFMKKDGEVVFENNTEASSSGHATDRSKLHIEDIKDFADQVDITDIKDLCEQQIRCNMDIAYEGISGNYGLGLGRVIRESYADCVVTRMKEYTAAASEARMDG